MSLCICAVCICAGSVLSAAVSYCLIDSIEQINYCERKCDLQTL